MLGPALLTGILFGVTRASGGTDAAQPSAPPGPGNVHLDNVQPIDYHEECVGEGCDNEEIEELWNSYQQECVVERCWTEEVFELSGGERFHTEPYSSPQFRAMLDAFRFRLGKQFTDAPMKMGPTDDVWAWIIQNLDGHIFKTPDMNCDPYCG